MAGPAQVRSPAFRFLEALSSNVTAALKEAVLYVTVHHKVRKKTWSFEKTLEFLAVEPPNTPSKSLNLAPPESALHEEVYKFLPGLAVWLDEVMSDGYFNLKARVSPTDLLELGMLIVAAQRYGGWDAVTDLMPIDFVPAYLRGLAESCLPAGSYVCPLRLSGAVSGWEDLDPSLFAIDAISHYHASLIQAESFGVDIVEGPSREKWQNFITSLPEVQGGGSERMKKYLSETLEIAEGICELWESAQGQRRMPVSSPPCDIVGKSISASRGRMGPEGFVLYLQLATAERRKITAIKWEILPPGWWGDPSWQKVFQEANRDRDVPRFSWERLAFLGGLGPLRSQVGALGEQRTYWVFEFEHHAVAECATEGNAIYLVDKRLHDWESILPLTKRQALCAGATRLFHDPRGKWKRKIARVLGIANFENRQSESISSPVAKVPPPSPRRQTVAATKPMVSEAKPMATDGKSSDTNFELPATKMMCKLLALFHGRTNVAIVEEKLLKALAPLFKEEAPVHDAIREVTKKTEARVLAVETFLREKGYDLF